MNHAYVNNNHLLPINEECLYEGVIVFWKLKKRDFRASKPTWHSRVVWNESDSIELLNELWFNGAVENYFGIYEGRGPVDFVIMNKSGEIIRSNFDAQITEVEENIFSVKSKTDATLKHYVIPFETIWKNGRFTYCVGKDTKELNREIRKFVERKWIKKPKGYKKDVGLVNLCVERYNDKQKEG